MRLLALPFACLTLIAAQDSPEPPERSAPESGTSVRITDRLAISLPQCADRIRPAEIGEAQVRINPPRLEREPSTPDDEPYLIWAVDRREAGCGVMVMKGDLDDVRQVPNGGDDAELIEIPND